MELILYGVLALLGVFALLFCIAAIHAVRLKAPPPQPKPFTVGVHDIDAQKHASRLSRMIQVPSVSERGNPDQTKILQMHACLEALYPKIHNTMEKTNLDGALLFKWKGSNPAAGKPILLMSHMDVVEAVGKWKYPPFSGTIAEGKIWGRGTVDTKGALCAILEAAEYLIEQGFTPQRDVYIASSCNEEITGDGAVKTVEYLFQKGIQLELVMDEGGAVMGGMLGAEASSAMVGVVEKGRANVRFTAHSHGGHASIPFKHNPFARLAHLIDRVETKPPFKKKINPTVRRMYAAMCPHMSFLYRLFLGNLWLFGAILPPILSRMGGQAAALIQSTCVFTMAQGSHGANVIPETASVTANIRFAQHEPMQPTLGKLEKLSHKNHIDMEMITGYDCCPEADTKSYAYKKVVHQIRDTFGEIPIVPYVMLAGTDSRHYTKICNCVLRFVPLTFSESQQKSAHAVNENLNVDSLARAVVYYVDLIKTYGEPLS